MKHVDIFIWCARKNNQSPVGNDFVISNYAALHELTSENKYTPYSYLWSSYSLKEIISQTDLYLVSLSSKTCVLEDNWLSICQFD